MAHLPERRRRRRRSLLALAVAATVLAVGGVGTPADAQSDEDLADQFGGIQLSGRSNGFQITYDLVGVLPIPSPIFQVSVPEALATMASGPTSTGLASSGYPGNLLANLPGVLGQARPETCAESPDGPECHMHEYMPPYPLLSRSDYPAGPSDDQQIIGTATSQTHADAAQGSSASYYAGIDVGSILTVGSVTTTALSHLVTDAAESRSRVALNDISLLFGLLRIDSIVTDLVATATNAAAATAGGTVISGVRVLGVPATLGPDGLVITPSEENPLGGPLTPLNTIVGGLPDNESVNDALAPLNELMQSVTGTVTTALNELLASGGITVQVMEPIETITGSAASRVANGVVVSLRYDGRTAPVLSQILAAIPAEDLPSDSPTGTNFNSSPQAMFNLLRETHVIGFAIGYGAVSAQVTDAFTFTPPIRTSTGGGGAFGGTPGFPGTLPAGGGFTTPTPAVTAGGGSTPVEGTPLGIIFGSGIGGLVGLALLSAPLWAIPARKLADNVLNIASSSCPDGLDRPGSPGSA